MASLQSQFALSVVKKSDILSAVLLSAYKRGGSMPTLSQFIGHLGFHVAGNVASNVLGPNKPLASLLEPWLTGDETCSALLYGLSASFRDRRGVKQSAMESAEYVVSEKVAKMLVAQFFESNEIVSGLGGENL